MVAPVAVNHPSPSMWVRILPLALFVCYTISMATVIAQPSFLEIEDWRDVVKNNGEVRSIEFVLVTDETWLPLILVQAGFFTSNSEVKKNRSDLWRDAVHQEWIKMKWCKIHIHQVSFKLDE